MQIEQHFMKEIITLTHRPRVFELIVREAMDTIVQDGEVKQKCVLLKLCLALIFIFLEHRYQS